MRNGRERSYAVQNIPSHQQPALGIDVVAERNLREIVAIESDQETTQERPQLDAARSSYDVRLLVSP